MWWWMGIGGVVMVQRYEGVRAIIYDKMLKVNMVVFGMNSYMYGNTFEHIHDA